MRNNGSRINTDCEYKGLKGRNYHYTRKNIPTVRFSLQCRIHAIGKCLSEIFPTGIDKLIDIGSADGLLVEGILELMPTVNEVYALDLDRNLLSYNIFLKVQSDSNEMPFETNTFDAITAAAFIEHLSEPHLFLKECNRVLKPGGALLLTCPAPFFDWLATKIGYLKDAGHLARYGISEIQKLCESVGFKNVYAEKFMISPVYFPGHLRLESILRKSGLSFLMLNQIIGSIK